ncbi:DNA primase [Nubsella zeaxanthinifaciens]|uniref:DNA primase n=1 Tax=Nubsella zeaxanthinifaciens TaxID=392412 RepID=UPI000DE57502|nr:DNA primase [Nubsella zeaxanthinifaciens]
MITAETIEKIKETARIEEVVGDFVHLKKRGTSLIGNCPFHGEKTPSFHVSVSKGIYKCFGCGVAGDSVRFVMDHEKYSYPEALKYLANKYNIEVEETVESKENIELNSARESLYIVSQFAANFFEDQLWNSDDGKAIGLSYFKERGFREDIIKKFNLGYSPDVWDALTQEAIKNQHAEEYLEKTGLAIRNDKCKLYDRFRGRVMFPIHNFTGRVIGFGGRTLKTDKNVPKYVNSPESDIYHKSNVLYGLYHAKKAIRDQDNCYLVEGYADVLAVHQAYIENVVASSGTSLTIEQIKLISRFTQNVTILYDGDAAGIKASLRGLDMILEEGLNVKVVSFPDGDDPDSYMHKVGAGAFKTYIEEQRQDFILYKANILLAEAGKDPIKRAGIIRDIVESIAKIPDNIKASVFVRECSHLLEIEERVLLTELNAIKVAKSKKSAPAPRTSNPGHPDMPPDDLFAEDGPVQDPAIAVQQVSTDLLQEQEIIRLLLLFGHEMVNWEQIGEMHVGSFIIQNLGDVSFDNDLCKRIVDDYISQSEMGELPTFNYFLRHKDAEISNLAITLTTSPYQLSENWLQKHQIYVKDEAQNIKSAVLGGLYHLKKRKVDKMLTDLMNQMKEERDEVNLEALQGRYMQVKNIERVISKFLGSVIVK